MKIFHLYVVLSLWHLCTRNDLDSSRIGATGISGGGMATFFLAAIDERVKASAPVSGVLSTVGWIKHRLSSAHCDCQYPVNSCGLLYSEVGALTAPRAQLLCNADSDRGFPMDAFNETVDKMREIYRLYNAGDSLRTAVVPGGHADTETIRLPVYSFFLKEFLGINTSLAEEGPVDTLPSDKLVCWQNAYPLEERLTRIDEELIPAYSSSCEPLSGQARQSRIEELTRHLRSDGERNMKSIDIYLSCPAGTIVPVAVSFIPDLSTRQGVHRIFAPYEKSRISKRPYQGAMTDGIQ